MGLNGKQLLENFKEDEAYGNTTYTPPDDSSDDDNGDNAWKYISAGDISGLVDYTNRNYNYRTIPFLGQIVGHAADAATQGVADVAQFVGAQGVGDYLNEKAQEGEAELPAMSTPELSLAYLTDPNGLASAFGMMAGSMLSTAPVAAIAPELLPARAAMALSKVPKALSAVPKIGGALEEMAPMAGRFALTGPVEAMMEGGNTEREMLQNGATPEEARQAAWNVFGENVGLLTATNALEGGLLGKIKIKTPHFSNPVVNTASRVAGYVPTTAAEMALQGYEEGAQQGIQNGVEGESPNTANQILNPFAWTDDQWDAAKLGLAGAVPLMGAMGAIRHFGNRGDNGSTAADSLLDQAQDDIDSITSQTAQQSVIQSAQQDMENNPYTAPTATQDTSYEAPSDTSDTSSGSSYDASALEGDPQYTVSGEVSSTDVTPLTDQKMRLLDAAYYNKYGQHLFVTSMKRNGDGGSWHDSGQAFDTADDNLENNKEARDWLISEGEKLGLTPLDEYEHPSAKATGGHIHFSDHGEPIPDGIRVGESDSDMDDNDTDDSTGGVDLSNLPVGDIAMAIAQNTNLPVNFIWSQLSHESDGGKSKLAVEDHNYGGVKGNDGEYLHFDNDQQFIDYMSRYYPKYREDGIYDAQTADQFAEALQHGGYFTADLGEYEGGMHRYLEQAGLSQDAMSSGKARRAGSKGGDSTSGTPDLSGSFEISADDPAMDSMFASFAKDWQNMSTDANEINFFGDMFNSRNKFKATEENKQAILDNYGDAFRQYVQENHPQTVQAAQTTQAPAQPKQVPQPQHIEMQTPNLQTITTPKVEATTIQNVLSSFVQDKKNVARTEQEANLFDDMLDADDHFIDTPKNRQTLLKNYGAQLQDYVDDAMTPSLTDRVNQAIEQAVQNKDLNRMNTLTQAKQANDTAALEKLVGPQTKQHVDIAAMLTPANTDMKNHVSSTVQANAPVYQTATMEHQAPQTEVASTVQGNVPVNQVAATEDEQKAFRKAGLVYRDSNYNGTERVKTAPLYEEGDRRMNGGKAETKVKAQTAGKADKYKKDAEKIYLRFKSGKFSTEDSIKQLNNLKKKATSDKALSDEERADVTTEADKHINRIKPQKKTKKHETQKYSSKTSKTTQSGKAEGHPHQHAEPEPRKAADTQPEAEAREVSATKKAADEGWQESKDETKLSAAEEQAPSGTSDEAKQVYTIVRDQLTTSKSAQCAASVGAAILAHHADVYAKAYSKATGKKYTAMDYLNEKFGLNMTGQPIEGRAFNQAMSKSKATSLAEFAQIATSGEVDPNGKKKTFYSVNATNDIRVDFPIDDTRHSVNKHNLTGQQLQAIEDNLENIVSAYQDTKKKGHYGGLPVLAHIVTPIGDAGITFEFSPYGRVFVTTMFFDTKQNIENWAQKNGASRSLADDKSASSFTGHPLSISTIQQKIGIGNEKVYNQTAWHGSPYDFDRFDLGAIGTGEGAQVHGWGLYFAANREVSEAYKDALSRDVVEQKHYLYLAGNKYEYPDGTTLIRADNGKVSSNPILSDVAKLIHNLGSIDAAVTRLEKLKQGYETRGNTGRSYQHVLDALKVLNDDKTYEKYEDQKRSTARLYQVDIPDADTMLDEDKPLSEQPKIMQLLDAHAEKTGDWSFSSEELDESDTGRDFYKYLKEALHSPREASKYLNAAGINGITYNGGRDGRCYVVFDDEAVSVINKYNQMVNGKVQGETAPLENGRRVVSLFEHADESTFLHEMGHVFLLDLQDLAEVDQTAANDMAAVEGWTTWKKGQAKEYKGTAWEQEFADRENAIVKAMVDGDEETVNQLKDEWAQERFARGLERYLESGEAPSSKLKDVFEKFKQFLTHIYNAFKGEGGKPSEDVQNVMARMMDSDVENTVKVPPMGKAIIGRTGKETTVTTDSGKTIRVRYRLVPTARVITSHNAETMAANKAYPQELQPRDRQRVSMMEQVTTMANELRPADLGAGRNLNQGAPIIRKDGVVLNGNGRAMAIQKARAMKGKSATAYNKYLAQHAREFGFTPDMVMGLQKPMLVREVVDDIDANTMQDIINSTVGGSRMGASEQAKADAKKIKPSDLEQYADNENGDLTTAANRDFVASILYRIISKSERNAYTDKFGNANADGIERVKRALFSLAYGDDGLISKMSESTDDNISNVSRGLMSAAPAFANVSLAVKDGRAYDYDVAKTISEAVKRLDALRKEGKQVRDYLNEQSMFSEYQDTDEMRDVLRFFDDNKRSGKKIGIFLNDIANSIMMQGDPNQTSLMNGERATLGEIIKTSARVASNGTSSADLFADVQEAPTKAKENTTQAIDDIRYSAKQNDAQVKRSLQAVVDEAKKAFPNAKNIRQDGGHISMDMPNGAEVQINVVPSIEVNNEEAGRARAAHGLKDDVRIKINGGERTVGRTALIELSQLGRKGSAYHEAFHAVYDLCLTEKEKAALYRAFDKEAKAQGRDVYEVMADKYRDWMIAKQKGRHTLYGKLWQKVKDAAAKLARVVRGADSASDVFRKVASGEAWERPLNEGSSDNRYLVTNEEVRPDTEVPIVDVTNEKKINVNSNKAAADIAKSLQGVTFRIIASNGVGKIETLKEGKHFVHGSNNLGRFDKTRAKALSVSEKILDNCVYIEKHPDAKHGTNHRYIELFAAVKDGRNMVRFRVVAREGDAGSGEFKIGQARFYDIIKDGKLPMYDTNGRNSIMGSSPSTLTVAELLKSVKDREGHLYVNKDGSLNYDTRIFHNGEEQGGSPSDVRNSADLFAIRPGEPIRYSLDANDNSKPSLFTRAYNHLTGRKNAASHDKNVKAMLEDITKMRIRFGKLDPKTETVFKKFEGVIRARNANEWEKVLPEAGRAIADRLNLKPSEDMNNYIAKWLLDEATNDTSQEASDFAAALKNDPVLSDQLVDLKTLFNERNNREADEVVRDAIQYEKPKERTTLTKAWETFYDEMIEELGPVKRMVKRVQEKSGQELAASVNPYIALRLFRGNAGRAMTMIEGQSEVAVKALQTNYPGVNFNDFKTLHMILDECGALHNEKRMKDFLAFALACHVKDIHTLNNRIRKSQQRLRDKIADLNDKINNLPEYQQLIESDKKVDDKYQEQREAYQKEIEGYQAKIDKAEKTIMEVPRTEDGLSLTEDRCNKVMMKYMKEYGEAQQDLVHFSKVTTSILYDAGVISKKRYKELQERWPNYIPMFRVFEDNEEVDFGDSLKHMHGSTRRIINPLDSIIRNTYDFVKKAERNKARQLLADLTRISDVGEYIEEVDNSKPNDKTTITFYENGERKYLQTDPDIVKAVNNMGREESNWVLRLLHGPAKIARACFTTINPSFALRNLIRDSTDATIYSKYGFKPWDFVRGFLHAVHRDELFYEWLSSGAAQASAISLDRDYTQATLNQMSKTWKERLLSKEFLPAILEGMQMVGEYSEYGTRIAAYERAKKKLAGENGPHPAAYDLASAAFESRDLMDFARGGRGSRHLNNVVVFANASIQGFDKFFRTFDFRKPYRKESMKALARLFLCGMLPALLLAGIHSGDDWWEELPDWQKETNWILGKVGNTIIRIPKGQDIGLRFFSNLIEKAMDRSKHKAGDYFKPVWDSLPDMIPTALLPIIEATANHSYFTGAPVVPKYQEKLPAYLQFGNETSSFAKFVGKVIGVSPRKVEHVLFGYTGNMGKGLLGVYDTIVGNQSLNTNLNEAPVISGFTAIPYKQSKTVNDFYDKFDEQQRLNEEFKLTKKKPDGYDPSLYKRMTKAQQELSKINKQERAAIDDPKMDSGVREQKQLGYQQQRLSVVRRVMGQ